MKAAYDPILCLCLNITRSDLQWAVEQGAATYEQVQQLTRCGTSCGMCQGNIRAELDWILEHRQTNL